MSRSYKKLLIAFVAFALLVIFILIVTNKAGFMRKANLRSAEHQQQLIKQWDSADLGDDLLNDWRTGKNTQHSLVALMRQSIFSRLKMLSLALEA